jgi:hypothetical protein
MSESPNNNLIDRITLRVWIAIFGPQHARAWHAAGLSWEQARAKQREFFVARFGAEEGNHYADLQLPTLAAVQCANVKRDARIEVLKAQLAAKNAENALLKRMRRDARAADETARMN